jgi:diaminohydroxyphosphoribosylaminopyrimidine deaminase/5-amino-6-(5-phosphoribosylamino)uracil reductase
LVGAVIVDSGNNVVGEGWHRRAGEAHAEVNALTAAGKGARGATAYVTLEPCCHHGRTGPCCEALLAAGIRRVVIAVGDPNPKIAGNGIRRLREGGVEVTVGVLAKEAARQNEIFLHWITSGRPFVAMKYAMTLDGKIAAASGDSRWITGEAARGYVHRLRNMYDAILVGKNTVLADNPELTCRLAGGHNPLRVILDARLETPLWSKVLHCAEAKTLVVAGENAAADGIAALQNSKGVEVVIFSCADDLTLRSARALSERKITKLLVEGGRRSARAFLTRDCRRVRLCRAASVGGKHAVTPVSGRGCDRICEGPVLHEVETRQLGSDFMITGRILRE